MGLKLKQSNLVWTQSETQLKHLRSSLSRIWWPLNSARSVRPVQPQIMIASNRISSYYFNTSSFNRSVCFGTAAWESAGEWRSADGEGQTQRDHAKRGRMREEQGRKREERGGRERSEEEERGARRKREERGRRERSEGGKERSKGGRERSEGGRR